MADGNLNLFERTMRSVWHAEPALRQEFGDNLDAFLALRRAQAQGQCDTITPAELLEPLKRLWREAAVG